VQTVESADVTAFLGTISPLKRNQLLFIASSMAKSTQENHSGKRSHIQKCVLK
jgi:hypothetical protein